LYPALHFHFCTRSRLYSLCLSSITIIMFFFSNDTAPTEIYTLSLHDALPILNLTPSLATGDYYVAIVDFAGTTTTYEVCVGWVPLLGAGTCNTPTWPSPPATSTAAPRRRRTLAGGARSPFVPSRR